MPNVGAYQLEWPFTLEKMINISLFRSSLDWGGNSAWAHLKFKCDAQIVLKLNMQITVALGKNGVKIYLGMPKLTFFCDWWRSLKFSRFGSSFFNQR